MINEPNTLSAAGLFPITEGPIQIRQLATLPLANAYPAGTAVLDSQKKIAIGDGVSKWFYHSAPNTIILRVDDCNTDLGAAIINVTSAGAVAAGGLDGICDPRRNQFRSRGIEK